MDEAKFLKAVFHEIYIAQLWILCANYSTQKLFPIATKIYSHTK